LRSSEFDRGRCFDFFGEAANYAIGLGVLGRLWQPLLRSSEFDRGRCFDFFGEAANYAIGLKRPFAVDDAALTGFKFQNRTLESRGLEKLMDWFSGWKASFEWLRKHIGLPGAVVVVLSIAIGSASLYVWSNWKDFKERPGVTWIVGLLERRAIQTAPAGRLTIAVAHLARDNERLDHEHLLFDELRDKRKFEGVEIIRVDRTVDPEESAEETIEAKARALLKQTGADVLIWGCGGEGRRNAGAKSCFLNNLAI
jgi:hypothetical protein